MMDDDLSHLKKFQLFSILFFQFKNSNSDFAGWELQGAELTTKRRYGLASEERTFCEFQKKKNKF
jgi:hypothetical protein